MYVFSHQTFDAHEGAVPAGPHHEWPLLKDGIQGLNVPCGHHYPPYIRLPLNCEWSA